MFWDPWTLGPVTPIIFFFALADVFCYMSIYYDLMNALFLVFLQKKHNAPQNINKSFNLMIPFAKPKSHVYLARKQTLVVNDIFLFNLVW